MKKAKGVAVYEDPRMRFKYQSLIQDYDELEKETLAKTERLERMKQKKLILLAEVQFLRRRYKYLMSNQSANLQSKRHPPQPNNVEAQGKHSSTKKRRRYTGKETVLRQKASKFDLNHKVNMPNGKETATGSWNPVPLFDLNQKGRTDHGKEPAIQSSAQVLGLNLNGRVNTEKDIPVRNITPVFDLNQSLTEEEEEPQTYGTLGMDEPKKGSIKAASEEQLKEMKLLLCRNIGDGSKQVGKRKISWQDQVALRV